MYKAELGDSFEFGKVRNIQRYFWLPNTKKYRKSLIWATMRRFHDILENTIKDNLEQSRLLAECVSLYIERIPRDELLHHLKINREKIRSSMIASLDCPEPKDIEFIERSLKKIDKGDFNLLVKVI